MDSIPETQGKLPERVHLSDTCSPQVNFRQFSHEEGAVHPDAKFHWLKLLFYPAVSHRHIQWFWFSYLYSLKWTYTCPQGWYKEGKNQGCFCRSEQSFYISLLQFSKTKEDKEHSNLLQGSLSWSTAAFINLSHGTYATPGTKVMSQMKMNLTKWCSVFWLPWCMNCPFVDAGNWIKWRSHTVRERVASSFKTSLLATCDKSDWNQGLGLLFWI